MLDTTQLPYTLNLTELVVNPKGYSLKYFNISSYNETKLQKYKYMFQENNFNENITIETDEEHKDWIPFSVDLYTFECSKKSSV